MVPMPVVAAAQRPRSRPERKTGFNRLFVLMHCLHLLSGVLKGSLSTSRDLNNSGPCLAPIPRKLNNS